jgi:uncharacterized metal-binding protein
VHRRAQSRSPDNPVDLAYVAKRIIGLEDPNKLVTEQDIEYFRGKVNRSLHHIQDLGVAKSETSDIKNDKKKKLVDITGQDSARKNKTGRS